jgi:hypothetical protein
MTKDEFQPPMYLGKLLVSELSCEVGLKHGLVSLSSNMLIVCVTSLVCVWCSGAAVIAAFTYVHQGLYAILHEHGRLHGAAGKCSQWVEITQE